MKKLDKLILKEFSGPFVLTFAVMLFIFLTQYMIKNFKHFVGKDLGLDVFGELFFYFALVMVPVALPIAVLLSTLMTYGSLGQHSELSAIKSAGIPLTRILVPVGVAVFLLSLFSLWYTEAVVPKANLSAYSLLYDIKQKKPTMELTEGAFYSGMDGYSIRVQEKLDDERTLLGVMIYNHTRDRGNNEVVIADTGYMETVQNEEYLLLQLKNGESYTEINRNNGRKNVTEYVRNDFDSAAMFFSMDQFSLQETKRELFMSHNLMKQQPELVQERDSVRITLETQQAPFGANLRNQYFYLFRSDSAYKDNTRIAGGTRALNYDPEDKNTKYRIMLTAFNKAKSIENLVSTQASRKETQLRRLAGYDMDIFRRYTQGVAVFVMFLIGAPLGAIIKKGGLGVPVLVSVAFFVIYYVLTISGDKLAKEMVVYPAFGSWASNVILTIFGLYFLLQARKDARLFDPDYYAVLFNRYFGKKA